VKRNVSRTRENRTGSNKTAAIELRERFERRINEQQVADVLACIGNPPRKRSQPPEGDVSGPSGGRGGEAWNNRRTPPVSVHIGWQRDRGVT
jgi:hypothetical protein